MKHIDLLLQKYWEAETTLEEEKELQSYFQSERVTPEHEEFAPLFQSFHTTKSMSSNIDVEAIFKAEAEKEKTVTKETKVFSLKRYIPAVAASMIGILGLAFLWNSDILNNSTKENYVVLEKESDQEEAIRVTREALALLSSSYKKGTDAMANIKHFEKTRIFK